MPIIGIVASGASNTAFSTKYESIYSTTITSGSQATVTFDNIPSIYKHLQVRVFGRATGTGNREYVGARFNNDTGNNYVWHGLNTNTTSTPDAQYSGGLVDFMRWGFSVIPQSDAPANFFGMSIIEILDYTNTNKKKASKCVAGQSQADANSRLNTVGNLWTGTAAISRIDLFPGGNSWNLYSSVALYGIKD
jgi:hypothetical protein